MQKLGKVCNNKCFKFKQQFEMYRFKTMMLANEVHTKKKQMF